MECDPTTWTQLIESINAAINPSAAPWHERYQTAIAAVVGFMGLIATTYMGFKRSQESQQLHWIKEDEKQAAEAKNLAVSLTIEIGAIAVLSEVRREDILAAFPKNDGGLPGGIQLRVENSKALALEGTLVYEGNTERIGTLPHKVVLEVVSFYSRVFNYNTMVREGIISKKRLDDLENINRDGNSAIKSLTEFCSFSLPT